MKTLKSLELYKNTACLKLYDMLALPKYISIVNIGLQIRRTKKQPKTTRAVNEQILFFCWLASCLVSHFPQLPSFPAAALLSVMLTRIHITTSKSVTSPHT